MLFYSNVPFTCYQIRFVSHKNSTGVLKYDGTNIWVAGVPGAEGNGIAKIRAYDGSVTFIPFFTPSRVSFESLAFDGFAMWVSSYTAVNAGFLGKVQK